MSFKIPINGKYSCRSVLAVILPVLYNTYAKHNNINKANDTNFQNLLGFAAYKIIAALDVRNPNIPDKRALNSFAGRPELSQTPKRKYNQGT